MEVPETCAKRESKDCNSEAKPPSKRSIKYSPVGCTKAVIICNSSEVSKSEENTYRPNNIAIELLKKDSRRYGKMTFPKLASEQEIRQELCLRFPILKKKTFRLASADQYGKLNFHEFEEWSSKHLRRWLPGSSAMYLILEEGDETDEPASEEHPYSTKYNSPSSGKSYTTMRTDTTNDTVFSRNGSQSQRALQEFLSSRDKAKMDQTKRRKIFDTSLGSASKSCSLPRSSSFHSLTDLVKTEKIDTNLKYDISCRLENSSPNRKRKHVTDESSSSYSMDDSFLRSKRIAHTSRTLDSMVECTPREKVQKRTESVNGSLLRSKIIAHSARNMNSVEECTSHTRNEQHRRLTSQEAKVTHKRDTSQSINSDMDDLSNRDELGTSGESRDIKPRGMKWLPRSRDTLTKSPAPHDYLDQRNNSHDRKMRSSPTRQCLNLDQNRTCSACDENPSHSLDDDNDIHLSAETTSHAILQGGDFLASGRKFQHLQNSFKSNDRVHLRGKRQQDKLNCCEEEGSENNNRDKSTGLDISLPCVVPCYVIPSPMYVSQFHGSMATVTSSSPNICVPNKEALSWEQEQAMTRPCVMPYKGDMAFVPLRFVSPSTGMSPYDFSRGNLATTSGIVDESQSPRNQQCQDTPVSSRVQSDEKVERTSLLQKYLRSLEEQSSSTIKQETTDQCVKSRCEIVPSKGTFKGGDVFVIVFEQSLNEELKKTRLSVKFGETEIDELTYVNPFTIKGEVPESAGPDSVTVTIATPDGELIGMTRFTYVDDFIDGLLKTMFTDQHGEVLMDFMTSSLDRGHDELQDKMVDIMELVVYVASQTGEKPVRDKILNSIWGNQLKCRLSNSLWYQEHVTHDGCHGDEENEANRAGISSQDQGDKEKAEERKCCSPIELKDAGNLILLSSIASRMKHDTPCSDNSDKTSLSSVCASSDFYKKVFVLPPNSRYLPSQSELCKLRMSGHFYSRVEFDINMSEDDVTEHIKKAFPDLKDSRLRLAMVDQTGKLVFHDEIWTGRTIRKKLRGNSVLYVAPIS